ncbi:MAG: AsmA family protein, partial [Gammaproteobacteria bacterium]|nr:AsmA family protein [Gammaproteobacteria bacterium]
MKLLKWIVIIVGAGVILFAGALAFIAATFDPNQYKQQVADLVKEKTQRTLTIEGDIRLLLFPKLGVYLGKTRLSGFRNEEAFAGLDEMRVSLALIPLLSRQVVVDQVQLVGLHAGLVKYKDGKTNFDDLFGGGEKQEPEPQEPKPTAKPEPEQPAAPIRFDVEGIRVSNAAVSWRDEAAGTEYKVSNIGIKTGRVAEKVPVKFELGAAFSASEPKLDVTLQSAGTLTADLQNRTYALAVLSAVVKAIGPQLDANVDIKLSDLQASPAMLRIGDVLVSIDAKQADNVVKGKLSTPVTANLETQVFELPKLAGEFDITAPALPMKTLKLPLAGTVSADLKQQMVNVDLTTKLDESNIKAKIALSQFDALFTR